MNANKYIKMTVALIALLSSCKGDNADNIPAPPEISMLQYIGLKNEANIRAAQEFVIEKYGTPYRLRMQIIGDHVYVPTIHGLYRKHVATAHTTEWELYAFGGVPVANFVKNGSRVLAITSNMNDKALLLSTDDGKTCSPATPDSFMENGEGKTPFIFGIGQNPENPNSLLALVFSATWDAFGVMKSTDFGKNWDVLSPRLGGYQNWFVGFHPLDTLNIYTSGEDMIFDAFIHASYDDGETWSDIETIDNNCIHHIAFHPTEPQTMIYSGEYIVKKSEDKGRTWRVVLGDEIYFYKTVYDKVDPNIVYASGNTRISDEPHKFTIYRSLNGGEDWDVFFQTDLPGEGGIIDMELYENRLFLYTFTDGIYMLTIPAE